MKNAVNHGHNCQKEVYERKTFNLSLTHRCLQKYKFQNMEMIPTDSFDRVRSFMFNQRPRLYRSPQSHQTPLTHTVMFSLQTIQNTLRFISVPTARVQKGALNHSHIITSVDEMGAVIKVRCVLT